MPHLVILYTQQLDQQTDISSLCRRLADTMISIRDGEDKPVFPIGGARVFAYPAPHYAVADGSADKHPGNDGGFAYVWLNLRMGAGRPPSVIERAGQALSEVVRQHFEPLMAKRAVGITLQVDEGHEVFNGKLGNLHAVFGGP